MFDGSMSSVAGNKIRIARRLGAKVGAGWIARPDGTPIMEETDVPDDFLMLPLGGTREIGSHKGYSLAVIVDILAGVLSGTGAGFLHPSDVSHHFTAWRIDAFRDVDAFKADMDGLLRGLRECPPAPGAERVLYAGLAESETLADRRERASPTTGTSSSGSRRVPGARRGLRDLTVFPITSGRIRHGLHCRPRPFRFAAEQPPAWPASGCW